MTDPTDKIEKILEDLRKYGDDIHLDFYDFDNDDDISPTDDEVDIDDTE
jgi:hypothetical protein